MAHINLFGLSLTKETQPKLVRNPNVKVLDWYASLEDRNLQLDIRLLVINRYHLELRGVFRLRKLNANYWGFKFALQGGKFRFSDGPPEGRNAFEFFAGWISCKDTTADFTTLPNGYLGLNFPVTAFVQNRQLPIALQSTGRAKLTLVLNRSLGPQGYSFSKPCLWFSEQSFEARTHIGAIRNRIVRRLFPQTWLTRKSIMMPIKQLDSNHKLDLTLQDGADSTGGILPLYGFYWASGDVSPAMGVQTSNICLSLGAGKDTQKLKKISVPDGLLRCHAFHDRKYSPLDWKFDNRSGGLRLAVQPLRTRSRLASFVVHPFHRKCALNLKRDGSMGPVLGYKSGVRYEIGRKGDLTVLDIDQAYNGPYLPGVDARLLFEATGAVIRPDNFKHISYAKAGNAYLTRVSPNNNQLKQDYWRLSGSNGILPCIPDEASEPLGGFQAVYHSKVNSSVGNYADQLRRSSHESHLIVGSKQTAGNAVQLWKLMEVNEAPVLKAYTADYQYGHVRFTHTWPNAAAADHFFVYDDGQTSIKIFNAFELDPTMPEEQMLRIAKTQPSGITANNERRLLALVKLGRGRTMEELLQAGGAKNDEAADILSLMPSVVKSANWIGCVLFYQKLNFSEFEILRSLVDGELRLQYLALSPDSDSGAQTASDHFNVYSRLVYKNPKSHPNDNSTTNSKNDQLEVLMQVRKVDITWSGRRLTKFFSETLVSVRSCLGLSVEGRDNKPKPTEISIVGSIDIETNSVRFLARSGRPVPLLPEKGFGPIKQLHANRLEIIRDNGQSKVDVDGDVEFQSLNIGGKRWFDSSEGDGVKFKGFGFRFKKLSKSGSWLAFDYPSFRFLLGKGGFNLLGLPFIKVKLKGLGVDFPDSGFDWNSLAPIIEGWGDDWDKLERKFAGRFKLGFELARLPVLSNKPFDALTFDFDIGIPFKDPFEFDLSNMKVHLDAVGFHKLYLDLMRFLTVRAERMEFDPREIEGTKVPWFLFKNVQVDVLEKRVIDRLDFHYFSVPDGESGFLGFLNPEADVNLFLIQFDWVLAGSNLSIPTDLAKSLISIRSDWVGSLNGQLRDAYEHNKLIPLSLIGKTAVDDWIFAAGFKVLHGVLLGKFLFQDNAYYGISMEGKIFEEWFGWKFAISVLYIKRERPEEDAFYIELRVPMVNLGAVTLKGGIIAVEIQMNGGFVLDMGFPWLDIRGIRNWDRAQGVFISGLMGKGGMYLAKRASVREFYNDKNEALAMFGYGLALMVGIGGAYVKGPFRVEAYAGIYIAAEGALLLRKQNLVGLRIVGAVGIQVRGIGELRWWIISIRIDVVIGAEARLTLIWGISFNPATGEIENPCADPTDDMEIQLDFVLYARVSARACIGKGWFKICKGISTGVSLPYRQRLRLGA